LQAGNPQGVIDVDSGNLLSAQMNVFFNRPVENVLSAAGDWEVISRAITNTKGGMSALRYDVTGLNGYDMQDIAAYLAQPNL
jgi:hypothetical protein